MNFSNKIKIIRETAGLTQKELANKINISQSAISLWEKSQYPPLEGIEKVCQALNYPLYRFFLDDTSDLAVASGLTPRQIGIIRRINSLPASKQQALMDVIEAILQITENS